MTFPDLMGAYGRLLYGDRWQTAIARDILGVSDVTVRRWWSGKERPRDPDQVLGLLCQALAQRVADILLVLIPPDDERVRADVTPLLQQVIAAAAARLGSG